MSNDVQIDEKVYRLLDAMYEDNTVTDGQGMILHISPVFEKNANIRKEEVLGKSVFFLEQQKILVPSVTIQALINKRKTTLIQNVKNYNKKIISTAVPVFNQKHEIELIVSYTWEDEDIHQLKEQHDILENLVKRYSSEIRELREKDMTTLGVIANSSQMKNVVKLACKVANVDANVLITGESGVGKNVVARLIHQKSSRNKGPFIEINCGAIPENLLESELFGYETGAFTGAKREGKVGMIEMAQDGTLFLDEVGELRPALQAKILKVIQEKVLVKVGGTRAIKVNFRLIAATNRDLDKSVREGQFREDLFYRLSVVPVLIPPLRERREDILPLVQFFLEQSSQQYHLNKSFSKNAIKCLLSYDWPGNVRELQNLIERLVVTTDEDLINEEDLPDFLRMFSMKGMDKDVTMKKALELLEKQMVQKAYERYKTTVGVSKALGISQPSAVRKLKKYVPGYSGSGK